MVSALTFKECTMNRQEHLAGLFLEILHNGVRFSVSVPMSLVRSGSPAQHPSLPFPWNLNSLPFSFMAEES